MLKNVKKLLLVFVLMVQLISPAIASHADEGIETADIINDLTDEAKDITPEIEIAETEANLEEEEMTDETEEVTVDTDVEDDEESNDPDVVWTAEELMFFDELWRRFHDISNEAWDLFFYIEAMHLAGTLMEHPNGVRLSQLLNEFNDEVDALATGTWIDTTLPFDHESNVAYLNKLNTFITIFDYFVTEFTTALEVVRLEIAERSNDTEDNYNDVDSNRSDDSESDDDNDSNEVSDNSDMNNTHPNNTLPQTGANIQLNTMFAGVGLATVGGFIVYRKVKRG